MEFINSIPDFLEFFSLEHLKDKFTEHEIKYEDLGGLSYDEWRELVPSISVRKRWAEYYPKAREETHFPPSFVGNEDLSLN